MPVDIYSTQAMQQVVRRLTTPRPFLLDTFFPNVVEFTEQEIIFDIEEGRRRIAPFVSPLHPAPLVSQQGYRTERFAPAYIKDKRPLNPRRPLMRAVGEQIGGGAVTPAQREAAILAENLQDQIDMITRRLELMAADVLLDGIATITGDGFPSVTVDFQRPAAHNVQLAGTARWGEAGVSPVASLEQLAETVLEAGGLPVTDIVVDRLALGLLRADPRFKDAVDTTLRGTTAQLDVTATAREGGQLVGYFNTTTRIWLYQNWFVDAVTGTSTRMWPDHAVLLASTDADAAGVRAFGAIVDPELDYQVGQYVPKSWTEKDPAQRIMMMQSAPLLYPRRPATQALIRVR